MIKTGHIEDVLPEMKTLPNAPTLTYQNLFMETSDEKTYRRIEKKDVFVKRVERVLKINAVDCQLNKYANIFENDKDYSRECDYMKCNYTCAGDVEKLDNDQLEINLDTYNLHFSEPQINRAQKIIYDIFKYNFVMDLESIVAFVQNQQRDIEREYIDEALDRIVGREPQRPAIPLVDRFNRHGYLQFANPYYIFKPDDLNDKKAPLYYRSTPLTVKKRFLNLDALKSDTLAHLPQIQKLLNSNQNSEILETNINGLIAQLTKMTNKYQINAKLDRLSPDIQEKIYETTAHSKLYSKEFHDMLTDYFYYLEKLYGFYEPQEGKFVSNKIKFLAHKINTDVRLYDEKTETWKTVDKSNSTIVAMEASMYAMKSEPHKKTPNTLHGFLIYNPKKKDYDFKLVDYEKQSLKEKKDNPNKKNTKSKPTISKKSQITGKVCETFTKSELLAHAVNLNIAGVSNATKIETLCEFIELKLRELDDKDSKERHFYGTFEPHK